MEKKMLERADKFAAFAHQFQYRKDGVTPAIVHPRCVVKLLEDIGERDENTLSSAVLHDTIEDCNVKLEQIGKEFNQKVAYNVGRLTKWGDREEYKKAIVESGYDVQIVKLADVVHNTLNLRESYLKKKTVDRFVSDCKNLYLPMARRLCPKFYGMLLDNMDGINDFSKEKWIKGTSR